jgi:phospholipid N-methyltransferase
MHAYNTEVLYIIAKVLPVREGLPPATFQLSQAIATFQLSPATFLQLSHQKLCHLQYYFVLGNTPPTQVYEYITLTTETCNLSYIIDGGQL